MNLSVEFVPQLSVCIPVGESRWVGETLASLEAQEFPHQLVTYEDAARRGAGWARNRCLEHATGEWILKLDADDLLTEGLLQQLWNARRTDTIVCPEAAQFFDETGPLHRWSYDGIAAAEVLTRIESPASSAGCLLYHRSLGVFPEDCGAYESWAFVCGHAMRGISVLPASGTEYLHRLHAGSYWDRSAPTRREELHRAMLHVNEVYAEAYA